MTLENQVCSLPLAKRLKELGVKQESQFRWIGLTGNPADQAIMFIGQHGSYPTAWDEGVAAFTVAELGEMLPHLVMIDGKKWFCATIKWSDVRWEAHLIQQGMKDIEQVTGPEDIEADARAKMLVYLLENKLIALAA